MERERGVLDLQLQIPQSAVRNRLSIVRKDSSPLPSVGTLYPPALSVTFMYLWYHSFQWEATSINSRTTHRLISLPIHLFGILRACLQCNPRSNNSYFQLALNQLICEPVTVQLCQQELSRLQNSLQTLVNAGQLAHLDLCSQYLIYLA